MLQFPGFANFVKKLDLTNCKSTKIAKVGLRLMHSELVSALGTSSIGYFGTRNNQLRSRYKYIQHFRKETF